MQMIFVSDAESCAVCEHAIKGAVIDGIEFPDGWHCELNDIAGTHYSALRTDMCDCKDEELWEMVWREEGAEE